MGATEDRRNEDWAHRTPRLRALELDFAVRSSDLALGRYVEQIFRAFEAESPVEEAVKARLYSLVVPPADSDGEVWLDDRLLHRTSIPSEILAHLLWHVNRSVIEASGARYLLVHASAAEHEGAGLLFPAAPEAGKTTLVAALVQAGLRYLTDEAAAIDMESLLLHPYPKALSIDLGSWEVLSSLRPAIEPDAERFVLGQWHVDPAAAIGPRTVAVPCRPQFIVAPQYRPGDATALVPIPRSEAVMLLARNSFNFDRHGRAALAAAAAVARQSACFRLTVSDLKEACRLVVDLVAPGDGPL